MCGDKIRQQNEQCDDGNQEDGDGCSAQCTIEEGFLCSNWPFPGFPCGAYADTCAPVCGDGLLVGNEVGKYNYCDDGNFLPGDGCSWDCTPERGFVCASWSSDMNNLGDCADDLSFIDALGFSCSSWSGYDCSSYFGYSEEELQAVQSACSNSCNVCNQRLEGACWSVCGDGIRAGPEQCDDGNGMNDDGCSSACTLESGWRCAQQLNGESLCVPTCGDGVVTLDEECDDGNTWSHDGCSAACKIECGWDCSAGDCEPICGDGMKRGHEECDDGNLRVDDGCGRDCRVESNYVCWSVVPANLCIHPLMRDFAADHCELGCGLGVRDPLSMKQCDDGNLVAGDGCSSS